MPRIPTVTSRQSGVSGTGGVIGTRTNARATGAGVAAEAGRFFETVENVAVGLDQQQKQKTAQQAAAKRQADADARRIAREQQAAQDKLDRERAAQVKVNVANRTAQFDFTARELELQNEVPPTADGYRDIVRSEFIAEVDRQASAIPDDDERVAFRQELMKKLPALSSRATKHEFATREAYNKEQANTSVSALTNRARLGYEETTSLVQQGRDVIDASPHYDAATKEGMKLQLGFSMWNAEFDGRLERASTPQEVDLLQAELTGPNSDYTNRLMPADMDRLSGALVTKRKAIAAEFKAEATSTISTLRKRGADVAAIIPEEELASAMQVVRRSGDPKLVADMERIARDEYIKRNYGRVPVSEMQRDITGTAAQYPGVNPTMAASVTQATRETGVPEEYLARFVAGAYPQRQAAAEQREFYPVASQRRVNMKGLDADVKDALMVAGQALGEQLIVTDAKRALNDNARSAFNLDHNHDDVVKHGADGVYKESYHNKGRAVDLRIRGKTQVEIASMVGALVDAGFTGIGVYDDHIHADFRDSVPSTFGEKDGQPWGGWTNLSPEVATQLATRGFQPGAKASDIKRSSPVQSYSDADMRTANEEVVTNERIETMLTNIGKEYSDEVADELRADPDALIRLVSMNASRNAVALKDATGQEASPIELALADELGLEQAVAVLRTVEVQPNTLVGELLPAAVQSSPELAQQTVRSVYNEFAGRFVTEASAVSYGDEQTKRKVMERVKKGLKDDPVTLAMQMNMTEIEPLDGAEGFARRGEDMRFLADLHGVPVRDLKPFAGPELRELERTLGEGTANEVLALVSSIQSMGDDVAIAAAEQLEGIDPTVAFAAELQRSTNNVATASTVIRGVHRLRDNPSIKQTLGFTEADAASAVDRATEGSLALVDPAQRQAMLDAAFAYAVETRALSGGTKALGDKDMKAALDAVLGGDVLHEVNGSTTVLPPGVNGKIYKKAASRMTVEDYTLMSRDKTIPTYMGGVPVSADDLEDEARLMPIGGGQYNLLMDDGTYVLAGETLKPFVYVPEPGYLQEIASRSRGRDGREGSDTVYELKYGR